MQVGTKIPTKWDYGKKYIHLAVPLYKNGLYKMMEPKPICWPRTWSAQNNGLRRAHALPFCAGNFKGDGLMNFFVLLICSCVYFRCRYKNIYNTMKFFKIHIYIYIQTFHLCHLKKNKNDNITWNQSTQSGHGNCHVVKQRSRCGNVAKTEEDGRGRDRQVFESNNPKVIRIICA